MTKLLDAATREALFDALLAGVLSGVHPFAGDPFQQRDQLEVVGEELTVWTDEFPARLGRASGGDTILALRSERADDDRIVVTDGWELPLADEQRTWWEVAGEIDLVHNGLEFVLTDATASWAILVLLDAQLVAGDPQFIGAYFGGDLGKEEAAQEFLSLVSPPEGYEEFKRLADYVRFAVEDQPGGADSDAADDKS